MGKEKKEIGKLLELLNEYCVGVFVYDNDILRFRLGSRAKIEGNAILISKSFGFIKWLVENDKIDRAKFGNSETKSSKYSDFELSYDTPREDYANILLMELAIQDEPIQFLIGILR